MDKKFSVLPILLFVFVGTAQADVEVITFDQNGSSFFTTVFPEVEYLNPYTVKSSYDGEIIDMKEAVVGGERQSGYGSAAEATSTEWVAYNPWANTPATFTSSSGALFDLNSFWLAGVWGSQTLTVTGYANGVEVNSTTISVNMTAQEYSFSGFQGLDKFVITTGNDYVRAPLAVALSGDGQQWALGSVTITTAAVPEPETWAMLLAGLGVVGAVARRRRAAT